MVRTVVVVKATLDEDVDLYVRSLVARIIYFDEASLLSISGFFGSARAQMRPLGSNGVKIQAPPVIKNAILKSNVSITSQVQEMQF